jgi:hypothetical protein
MHETCDRDTRGIGEKPCQFAGCDKRAIRKEKYCPRHRREMLRRMEAEGYLEAPVPTISDFNAKQYDSRDYGRRRGKDRDKVWDKETAIEQGNLDE